MQPEPEHDYLIKFLVASVIAFFIGSIHGVLQVVPPIRAWLDSVGSPYGGPGHMIDPLAHAHINLIGGVTILCMAASYYMITKITGRRLHSKRMAKYSFWWTTIGIYGFYVTLLFFGIWEGFLLLEQSPDIGAVHGIASPIIAITSTIMGIGLWIYMLNIVLTFRKHRKRPWTK